MRSREADQRGVGMEAPRDSRWVARAPSRRMGVLGLVRRWCERVVVLGVGGDMVGRWRY